MNTFVEITATATSTGGRDEGAVHRLYCVRPSVEEVRKLRLDGFRPVDFTSGMYASTRLLAEALKLSPTGSGLAFRKS